VIRPVVIIIILVNYILPILQSNGQEVTWFVLPAAWWLILGPEIITTVPSKTLTTAFNLPQAGCQRIGTIDLIPEVTGVYPPPIVHLAMGFVKHLHYIGAEGSPPLPKRRTLAPAVRPHQLELWKVASRDWIKKDYIIQEVPGSLMLDATRILYPYECTDVFRDEPLIRSQSNDNLQFITDVGIFALAFPVPLLLPFGAIAVSWKWIYIRNVSIMIQLHVAERSPDGKWGKILSCVGYRVCFVKRGVVFCKSHDVEPRMVSVCMIQEEKRKEV
jgi:hypothetical protein